jgi:hypothetical protein
VSLRVEILSEPAAFSEPAGLILGEAWQFPCLHYSSDYLRWQLSFPGGVPAFGIMAFDGDEPVAFNGVMPRRLRLQGEPVDVYLSSFHAVRPGWRGAPGAAVIRTGVRRLREKGTPVVMFAEPGSAGEQVVLATYKAFRYHRSDLGSYPTYGFANRPGPAPATLAVEATKPEFAEAAALCAGPLVLWNDPDPVQLTHYCRDPRQRASVVLRQPDGQPVGAAMVIRSEVRTATGIVHVPSIDSLFLNKPSADALMALGRFTAERWPGAGTSPTVVLAPNLHGVEPAMIRSAGFRATPSLFKGYLFYLDNHARLASATGTNLEVI